MCKISVIMSIYSEKEEWIKESIDSILSQTFRDFEFIIINDNPKRKENENLLLEYSQKDNRIIVITNKENIGLTKSLNKGLSIAKGKYIARMDADDISFPTRFQKQIDFLDKNTEYVLCGANISYFGSEEKIIEQEEEPSFLFIENPFAHPVVMFRNNSYLRYNENFKYAQDYEFWSNLYKENKKFYNIQEVLLKYRKSNQQISNKKFIEQQYYAGLVRRKTFNTFCSQKKIDFKIEGDINLKTIKNFKRNILTLKKWNKEEKVALDKFYYYLYRSIASKRYLALFYFIFSLDLFRLNVLKSIKISIYLLTNVGVKLIQ